MSCAIKLKGNEVAGSTFESRKFIFTDRDVSADTFIAVVYNSFSKINEIEGLISGNEVLFPFSTLEKLKVGRYRIEFWATMDGIGKKMIALEELFVSADSVCGSGSGSNEINVSITFKGKVINFTIQTALMYSGSLTWEKIEDKPEVFYDDAEIKEDIADINEILPQKVDEIEGFGLSKNNFSDAYKTKVDNLENYNDEELLAEIEKRVLKKDGWDLSQNNFTTGEKNKLAGLDGNKFFGKFADETALNAIVGIIGGYAYVGGVGRNDESHIWDDDDSKWVKSNNIPTAETPASVKTKYESNPDTNAFTNARRDKLNNAVVASDLTTANVGSATKLQNSRTINATSFDGTQGILTNVWGNARNITIGNSTKSVNGGSNVSWTLAEIGAVPVVEMVGRKKTIPFNVQNVGNYNYLPNTWVNLLLNSQGVDKTFTPFIEVSDDGVNWTVLSVTDIYKYFTSHETNLNITNPFFRFTFKTIESLYQYFYIGMRHRTSGLTLSGKYEFSANGVDNWVENTEGGNNEQVASAWGPILFFIRNAMSTRFHRLTIQRHVGTSIGFVQLMMYTNDSGMVDSYTVAKTDLQTAQFKPTTNFALQASHTRTTIIVDSNKIISVPSNLPDNFECTFIADGGTISFSNNGTVFKFNNSKVLLASGGIATLRKENGTNNFYLKGDLT